jgi:hypothetical protein
VVPEDEGYTRQQCQSGDTYPASRLSPSLSGNVLEVSCANLIGDTVKDHVLFAYLEDYDIAILKTSTDEDPAGVLSGVIESVTIEP